MFDKAEKVLAKTHKGVPGYDVKKELVRYDPLLCFELDLTCPSPSSSLQLSTSENPRPKIRANIRKSSEESTFGDSSSASGPRRCNNWQDKV